MDPRIASTDNQFKYQMINFFLKVTVVVAFGYSLYLNTFHSGKGEVFPESERKIYENFEKYEPYVSDTGKTQFELYQKVQGEIEEHYYHGRLPLRNEPPDFIRKLLKKYKAQGFDPKTNILMDKKMAEAYYGELTYAHPKMLRENLLILMAKYGNAETIKYLVKEEGIDPTIPMYNNENIAYILAQVNKWSVMVELINEGIINKDMLQACVGVNRCEATVYDVLMRHEGRGGLFDATNITGSLEDMRKILLRNGSISAYEINARMECLDGVGYPYRKRSCSEYLHEVNGRCAVYSIGCDKVEIELGLVNTKTGVGNKTVSDWISDVNDFGFRGIQ